MAEKEVDDDNERRNIFGFVSRKYNLASLLCAPWPSEQRYEPLSFKREDTICKVVTVALGNSADVITRILSRTNGLPSIRK